jgi:hypothetical protein
MPIKVKYRFKQSSIRAKLYGRGGESFGEEVLVAGFFGE